MLMIENSNFINNYQLQYNLQFFVILTNFVENLNFKIKWKKNMAIDLCKSNL